jgi:cytochrome b6-f complex iron-sulfur subunit
MKRRDFIKKSCVGCASVLGTSAFLSLLNSCAPLPMIKTDSKQKIIIIPELSFKENQNLLLVKNSNLEFDILLVKKKDNTYNALYMECTHHSQPLTANKSGLYCSAHGSAFNLEGNVTIQPATKALKKFKTEINNSNINIYLN